MRRAGKTYVLAALIAATVLATMMVPTASRSAQAATLFGQNLIVNGNAEAGQGGSTASDVVPVPGWTKIGGTASTFTAAKYGTVDQNGQPDLPSATDPGPADRGQNFFFGGVSSSSTTTSSASQVIDISQIGSAVDNGVSYDLSGYLGGWQTQNDSAVLKANFETATGEVIGTNQIGPVSAADRSNQTGLFFRSTQGTLPKETRQIELVLQMTRTDPSDSYIDGYADNLSLVLADVGAPSVVSESPVRAATRVDRDTNVEANFSEEMDPTTLTPKNVKLFNTATKKRVGAALSCDDTCKTLTLDPSKRLAKRTRYRVTILGGDSGPKDLAGNPMAKSEVWSFTTGRR